jgi:glycosyltransferase involved in cell wall biosynthesis
VRVSVIIPTRNEADAIGRVLADLPMNLVNEVIVIDNCSSDGTPEIAARLGARVISETRRGYGQACLTGVAAADAPMFFSMVITVTGLLSCRFSSRP